MIRIEVSSDGQANQSYRFEQGEVTIGRSPACDLVLAAVGISGTHARVIATGLDCMIVDENSTNGTYVNGLRVAAPTVLNERDEVYICSYRLEIISEAEQPQAEQPQADEQAPPAPLPASPLVPSPVPAPSPSPAPAPAREAAPNSEEVSPPHDLSSPPSPVGDALPPQPDAISAPPSLDQDLGQDLGQNLNRDLGRGLGQNLSSDLGSNLGSNMGLPPELTSPPQEVGAPEAMSPEWPAPVGPAELPPKVEPPSPLAADMPSLPGPLDAGLGLDEQPLGAPVNGLIETKPTASADAHDFYPHRYQKQDPAVPEAGDELEAPSMNPALSATPARHHGSHHSTVEDKAVKPPSHELPETRAPDESKRNKPQAISAHPGYPTPDPRSTPENEAFSRPPIEARDWSWPSVAARDLSPDSAPSIESQVFARLAQSWIESKALPPADRRSRAELYALAQAELATNHHGPAFNLEKSAELIVAELCDVGPLSELWGDPEIEALEVRGVNPIRICRGGQWSDTDHCFCHPYGLHFALRRMGGINLQEQNEVHTRLSDETRLTAISAQHCVGGPYLQLSAPPAPGRSAAEYIQQNALDPAIVDLLRAAIQAHLGVLICENNDGPGSLWCMMSDLAAQVTRSASIAWEPGASLAPGGIMPLRADGDPERQLSLFRSSLGLDLGCIAVDNPQTPLLEFLLRSPASKPSLLLRVPAASGALGCVHLEDLCRQGSTVDPEANPQSGILKHLTLVSAAQGSPWSTPREIAELVPGPHETQELQPLFHLDRHGRLGYCATRPQIYERLQRMGFSMHSS